MPNCKTRLSGEQPCLTIFTSIKFTSPIGLDYKLLKTRLGIQDKRRGENRKNNIYEQIEETLVKQD